VSGSGLAPDLVIDSPALVAILLDEPGSGVCLDALLLADVKVISAVKYLEAAIVLEAREGSGGRAALGALCSAVAIDQAPFAQDHARLALDAWVRFGKGRHPAGLDLGDCCACALARSSGLPLLAIGQDFPQTDVALVPLEERPAR